MVSVWRVETEHGRVGVFGVGAVRWVVRQNPGCDPSEHPCPRQDEVIKDAFFAAPDDWHFGVATLEQYRLWFSTKRSRVLLSEWRHGSTGERLRLRRYRVPAEHQVRSMFQTIFRRDHARIVEERSPNSI